MHFARLWITFADKFCLLSACIDKKKQLKKFTRPQNYHLELILYYLITNVKGL